MQGEFMEDIFNFNNLYKSYMYSRRGKRDTVAVSDYERRALMNTVELSERLIGKTYTPGKYFEMTIYEPKKRDILVPPFEDRVVQRCLCKQILEPAIENHLIYDSYSCRLNKGSHVGLDRVEDFLRRDFLLNSGEGWIVKGDISKFFDSIVHDILKSNIYPLLKEYGIEWLMNLIIYNERGVGLPLGNQSSQWLSNFYMSCFDHFVKEVLKVKYYVRYADDWVAIVDSKEDAIRVLNAMKHFLSTKLLLNTNNKTQIFPVSNGVDFLGFHLYVTSTGRVIRRIRRSSKQGVNKKLKRYAIAYANGSMTREEINLSYNSWKGHASHGSCYRLIQEMDKKYNRIFEGDD